MTSPYTSNDVYEQQRDMDRAQGTNPGQAHAGLASSAMDHNSLSGPGRSAMDHNSAPGTEGAVYNINDRAGGDGTGTGIQPTTGHHNFDERSPHASGGLQAGKPTMGDKIVGGAEKLAGSVTKNPAMKEKGIERQQGITVDASRNEHIRPKRSDWQKVDAILETITKDFRSIGRFLEVLFHNRKKDEPDPRTQRHARAVTSFLIGESNIGIAVIINLIYNHRQSRPPRASAEYGANFSPPDIYSPRDLNYAQPVLSTWALQIVCNEFHRQVGLLTKNDPTNPSDHTQLRASANARTQKAKQVRLVTWDSLGQLSIPTIADAYKRRAPAVWYATERMGAPTVQGVTVLRKRRPHTAVQVGAISALTLSRNRYAGGYLALPLAIWLFACKAHVDLKRVLSRFGLSVHDTTARLGLDSLTASGLEVLLADIKEGLQEGEMRWKFTLDNCQEMTRQRDNRLGRHDMLKVGTAATAMRMEGNKPHALDFAPYLERLLKGERVDLTVDTIHDAIDWALIHELTALHWVRILVHFIPQLEYLRKDVTTTFKSAKLAKFRLPEDRKTVMQPLGTNAERETETQGMMRALLDFEGQMGLDEKALEHHIIIPCGDGASVAAIWRIRKFMAAHPNHYQAFRNRVPPGPEIWHTRWTNLSTIASNSFGPAASSDPSSLSKSATAAGAKRPSNLKKVDFFPTSRSMLLFYEARVLDIWRIEFGADDLLSYFADVSNTRSTSDVSQLWDRAGKLVKRYASQQAFRNATRRDLADTASAAMRFQPGSRWDPPEMARGRNSQRPTRPAGGGANADDADGVQDDIAVAQAEGDEEAVDAIGEDTFLTESEDDQLETGKRDKKKEPKPQAEAADFDGDRVLANEIIFLRDMSWWVIANHGVPEGEIGWVWEVLKAGGIWIFTFSGSTNRNYANYLLETFCLHQYEASEDLSHALLNNWLINPKGKRYIETDWVQEDFNKWLEEMVEHKGANFDDKFYRTTLAPNVMHFLRLKEVFESAFDLKTRSKKHSAPHLRNEFQQLLRIYKDEELHLFRSGRTMGHIATNFYERGYDRLLDSRLQQFIEESTAYLDITRDAVSGKEEDDWDETKQRAYEQQLRDAQTIRPEPSDSEEDDTVEDEPAQDSAGKDLGGMDYSEDSDDDASRGERQVDDSDEEESEIEAEEQGSEGEEEEIDIIDDGPESEEEW
ncbi:hypothetical protein MKEN_01468500 [Mycena kentingensis (nom. inval.)]|nr:hypothetical protein MKEN_01468500 [Mycena kentingensis (nom. inval.)]